MKGQYAITNFLKKPMNNNNQKPPSDQPRPEIQFKPTEDDIEVPTTSTGRLRKKCAIEKKSQQPQFIIPEKQQESSQEINEDVEEHRFVISTLEQEAKKQKEKEEKKLLEKQSKKLTKKNQDAKPKVMTADEKKRLKQQAKKSKKLQPKIHTPSLLNEIEGNVEYNSDDDMKIKLREMQQTNQKTQIEQDFELAQKIAKQEQKNSREYNNKLFQEDIPKKIQQIKINPSKEEKMIVEQIQEEKSKKNPPSKRQSRSKSRESKTQIVQLKPESKANNKFNPSKKVLDNDSNDKPFEGKTIVFTGVFKHDRNLIETLITKLGGRVTGSVSGKTSFLLQGYGCQDGRPISSTNSSRKALQLKTPIITHDAVQAFFLQWTNKTLTEQLGIKQVPKPQSNQLLPLPSKTDKYTLWSQKYIPRNLDQVIGQSAAVNKARKWLEGWQNVHVKNIKHPIQKPFNYFYPKGDLNSKAMLFSGSPGIGKTTVARLLGQQYGYDVVEYNASDTRNKSNVSIFQTTSYQLNFSKQKKKILMILDEVDGLSGGDRGGSAAMIQIIKKSMTPIICICNDRQSTKIKSLGGHCYDVVFDQPSKEDVLKRLNTILQNQGIKYDRGSLVSMIQTFNGDMRQILNFLNLECMKQSSTSSNNKTSVQSFKKDNNVLMNLWSASGKLLNRTEFQRLNMRERLDLYFVDSEFIPLIVQNCLRYSFQFPKMQAKIVEQRRKQILDLKEKFSKACDYIEVGDILNRSIRKNQLWKLSPLCGLFSSVFPTQIVAQSAKAVFPQWLGNNSKRNKISRQLRQLQGSFRTTTSGGRKSTKDYAKVLFHLIHKNLQIHDKSTNKKVVEGQESGINTAVALMYTYRLTPDMIKQHLVDVELKNPELMNSISTATKTSLTKTYNERWNSSKTTFAKSKANKGEEISKYDPLMEEVIIEQEDPEDDQAEDKEEVIVQNPKGKAKAPKKNTKKAVRSSGSEDDQ